MTQYNFKINGITYSNYDDNSLQNLVTTGALTQAEADQIIADAQAVADAALAKKTGEVYADTGVTVPFTSEDASALLQVKAAFEIGVTSTVIHLSNGQKLPIDSADFADFATWFVAKRNSFFSS